MQKPERNKLYKAISPTKTVNRLESILHECSLSFSEKSSSSGSFLNSVVLNIINPGNGSVIFTTFGKGVGKEWARASAWGEMVERVQNLAMFEKLAISFHEEDSVKQGNNYHYFPDEVTFRQSELPSPLFAQVYELLVGNKISFNALDEGIIGVPFINMSTNKVEYLPYRELLSCVGSNGMCSGNTQKEALIQGISEIFERYVLKHFYLKPFTPPDIPLSLFEGTLAQRILHELTISLNCTIQIKDCSLDKGYPVVGVLIQDDDKYAFHLGADPSPITAVERCLSEMHQNGQISFQSKNELKHARSIDLQNSFWKKQLSLTIQAYRGHWPKDIFSKTPDYNFKGFVHPNSESDSADLNYLLKIAEENNREVYVRDNSFLGQPTYYIYIPRMSEIGNICNYQFTKLNLSLQNVLPLIRNITHSSKKERQQVIEFINEYYQSAPSQSMELSDFFKYNANHPLGKLSVVQFLALLRLSNFDDKLLDNFSMKEIDSHDILKLLYKSRGNLDLSKLLESLNIPKCFECGTCDNMNQCNFPEIQKIRNVLRTKQIESVIQAV